MLRTHTTFSGTSWTHDTTYIWKGLETDWEITNTMIISSGDRSSVLTCLADAFLKNVRAPPEFLVGLLSRPGVALLIVWWTPWEMIPVLVQPLETYCICFSPDFCNFSVKPWLNFNGLDLYIVIMNTNLFGPMDLKAEDNLKTMSQRITVTVGEISQNSRPDDTNSHSCSLKA